MKTYWFEIITEDGDLEGEEFFVEAATLPDACEIVKENFPGEDFKYNGRVSAFEAEMMGLDTY